MLGDLASIKGMNWRSAVVKVLVDFLGVEVSDAEFLLEVDDDGGDVFEFDGVESSLLRL